MSGFSDVICKMSYCDEGKAHIAEFSNLVQNYQDKKIDLSPNLLLVDRTHISWVSKGAEGKYAQKKSRHFSHRYRDYPILGKVLRSFVGELPRGEVGVMANDSRVYLDLMKLSLANKDHPVGLYVPLRELRNNGWQAERDF